MQPFHPTDLTLTPHSPWISHVHRHGKRIGTVSDDGVDGFTARDINHHSIGHGYVCAEAATQAWANPPDEQSAVTYPPGAFTQVQMPTPHATSGSGGEMKSVALTRAERQKAADLSRAFLDLIDHGY